MLTHFFIKIKDNITMKKRTSTLCKERMARELVRAHYEPGNQSRSLKQVWRRYAVPEMGVCYNTFLRLIKG